MRCKRGSARIGVGVARGPVNDQVPTHQIDLFEIVMLEGNSGEGPRIKAEQPAAAPGLLFLIQVAGQDFLFDTFRIPWRWFPAFIHVHLHEFQMGFCHFSVSFLQPAWVKILLQICCPIDRVSIAAAMSASQPPQSS